MMAHHVLTLYIPVTPAKFLLSKMSNIFGTSKITRNLKQRSMIWLAMTYEDHIGEYVNSQEQNNDRHMLWCEYPVLPSCFYIEVAVRIVLEWEKKQSNLKQEVIWWLAMNIQ